MKKSNPKTFQELIFALQIFWKKLGYTIFQPLDIEIGAATAHPVTYLKTLKFKNISAAYIQGCRRPADGRYAINSNRLQYYYQFQVITKPSSDKLRNIYLNSLKKIGLNLKKNDIQFIEDNWESPTLGAWGIGWEVRLNGIEITQFTYFQQIGGLECKPSITEISYGLERIAMQIQNIDNIYNLIWSNGKNGKITYGDIYYQNEVEQSYYNFQYTNINTLFNRFVECEKEILYLLSLKKPLPLVAYEQALKAIHIFNLLEARKVISITERQNYILRINTLTKKIAKSYISFVKEYSN